MLAGVMLAASCSKDDGTAVVDEIVAPNETPEAVAEQPAAQKTYPFSVQASKETSISKSYCTTLNLCATFSMDFFKIGTFGLKHHITCLSQDFGA